MTPLLLQTDGNGRVVDSLGRLIDEQGRLIDADGAFVDAAGTVLAAGVPPVFGGSPVRLSGGTLNAPEIHITLAGDAVLDGMVGELRSSGGQIVSDVQNVTVRTPADVRLGGRFEIMQTLDVRGREITVGTKGVVMAHESGHLFGERVTHAGYAASDQWFVLNGVVAVEVTGVVQSGDQIRVHAGVGADWTDDRLLDDGLTPAELSGGVVSVLHSGVLDAVKNVRIVSGEDVRLAADVVLSPNLTTVLTPAIVPVSRSVDVLVGPQLVLVGTTTVTEVHDVTTTVTEQVGLEQVRIGSQYHTLDVTLTQDAYFNGGTIREYFIQNVDYENETVPWASYLRQADGSVVPPELSPAGGDPVAAPDIQATFAQLTDDQRQVVFHYLNFRPLFNFSFVNAQTHRTVNGNTTTSAWTPDWAGNAPVIVRFDYPGLDDKFIRLPDGAQQDFLRAVSQGGQELPPELVGRYRDHADVHYYQDRSGQYPDNRPNMEDLDLSPARWYVTGVPAPEPVVIDGNLRDVRGGSRQYEIFDGRLIAGADGRDFSAAPRLRADLARGHAARGE